MCLIFFSLNQHSNYKLILAGNRDEFYNRPTAPAAFWEDHPQILAGRDLEAMGTWLGMTRSGKISMLTNYRDPLNIDPQAPSRGQLVSNFLINNDPADVYLQRIAGNGKRYNGFNLVTGNTERLYYYSNYSTGIRELTQGFFGLSNHLLDTPWPKVVRGKNKFESALKEKRIRPDLLFSLLMDEDPAEDSMLPSTGLSYEREKALSSMFIKTSGYGSRCSTVILLDRDNHVDFTERVFDLETFDYSTRSYNFEIIPD